MSSRTCIVLGLSAALLTTGLISGCGHRRAAARLAAREAEAKQMAPQPVAQAQFSGPIELSESTLNMIRKAPVKSVFVDEHGRVVRFVPEKLVAAEGATLPPENKPLAFLKVNAKGEVVDWKLAEVSGQ